MSSGRPTSPLVLTGKQRETLRRWSRHPKAARALAQRARIVLACAADRTDVSISAALGVTRQTVGRWRRRFRGRGLAGLQDEPRPGAPRKITDAQVKRVVRLTRETAPRGAACWSTRALAGRCGLSQTTVCRIWRAFALRPPRG